MCKKMLHDYQLRKAAGAYWLIKMNQPGIPYQPPVMLNEMGARIWQWLEQGWTKEKIAQELCETYDVLPEEALEDVQAFYAGLLEQGILIGE